jgi:hypothetical protein
VQQLEVVALAQELHHGHALLGFFEVVLLAGTQDVLEDAVQDLYDQGAVGLLQAREQDGDGVHLYG